MDKKILSRIFIPFVLVVLAGLWAAKVIIANYYPSHNEILGWYSLNWAVTIFLTAVGVHYLLCGIFMRSKGVIARRMTIIAGSVMLALALINLTFAIALPHNIIAPIIAIIMTLGLFIGILVTGGRKWDGGDNQNIGYKNYHQRKAEEEKAEKAGKK
jgi:hypothetical protein